MPRSRRVVAVLVAVALTLISAVALLLNARSDSGDDCTTALVVGTANGERVLLEDQHKPGRWSDSDDRCGDGQRNGTSDLNTLGFDCQIRNEHNIVVATTTPNRLDGTCGQGDDG